LKAPAESSPEQNLGPKSSSTLEKVLCTRCDGAIHPIARLTLADAFELQALQAESPSDQLIQIHSPGNDIPPNDRWRESTDAEPAADIVENFKRKECDLALVIVAVIQKAVAEDSSSREAFDLLHFYVRARAGFLTMMTKEVVSGGNVEMAN
jgi:hypothetical protein